MPGDNITAKVKLIAPIAMEQGLRFAKSARAAAPSAPASSPPSSNRSRPWARCGRQGKLSMDAQNIRIN